MRQHHQASFEDLPIDEDYRTPPRSRRRLWVGAAITIIAALCPLLAQLPVLNNLSTTLWLVSLPTCTTVTTSPKGQHCSWPLGLYLIKTVAASSLSSRVFSTGNA